MKKFVNIMKVSFVVLYIIAAIRAIVESIPEGDLLRTCAVVGIGMTIMLIICLADLIDIDDIDKIGDK